MRKSFFKILSVLLSAILLVSVFSFEGSAAPSAADIQNSINELERQSKDLEAQIKNLQKDINAQKQLKNAIEQKIAVVQQQIDICNNQITKINSSIAANNAEIEKNNNQIEADKLAFKKRLRAIYMSNTGSNVQILLGADDFSNFLQLSQLTASVSSRDKLLMEKLAEAIKALQAKQEENDKLLKEQVKIRETVKEKQKELVADGQAIQSVINDIDKNQTSLEQQNAKLESQIKNYKNTLASLSSGSGMGVYDGSDFIWPTNRYKISAYFKSNDPVHNGNHDGIDIIGPYRGEIAGAPVYAVADGTVDICRGGCSHNEPKSGWTCGCNGNFGNYVRINHGSKDGKTYLTIYGHMASISTSLGAKVKKGQIIGYVGSTGWSTGYHLHFGIVVNGIYRDPMLYYRKVG